MTFRLLTAASCAAIALALPAAAQQGEGTSVAISTHVVKPDKVEATDERIAQIKAPDGFAVKPFAAGLKPLRPFESSAPRSKPSRPTSPRRRVSTGYTK